MGIKKLEAAGAQLPCKLSYVMAVRLASATVTIFFGESRPRRI